MWSLNAAWRAKRLLPAGPPEAQAEILCRRRKAVETCVSGGAPGVKVRPATRTRRRYIAARANFHAK
jgi:hypothetical protein